MDDEREQAVKRRLAELSDENVFIVLKLFDDWANPDGSERNRLVYDATLAEWERREARKKQETAQ